MSRQNAVVRIRALQPDELSAWTTLRVEAIADAPDAFGDTLEHAGNRTQKEWHELLFSFDGKLLIAELDGVAAGMCRVARLKGDLSFSGLYSMWVASHARSLGVGKALVAEALHWAVLSETRGMMLSVTQL